MQSNLSSDTISFDDDGDESGLEKEEINGDIEVPFDPSKIDIQVKPMTIGVLLDRLKNSELDLTPDFQRQANLWDLKRKSRLIESVLLRIPLPSFYFSENEQGVYAVVDGLQRLCTLFHFIQYDQLNRVTGAKLSALRLSGLQYLKEIEGKSFDELDRPFQRRINELEITANIIRANTPMAVKFNLFARLNQGGMPLNAQEIRNAIYLGNWRNKLNEMAKSKIFVEATSRKIKTQRQQDVELVLRFVALWQLGGEFQRPSSQVLLDDFLNDAVDSVVSSWGDEEWSEVRKVFESALNAAILIFGMHAFRKSLGQEKKTPINRSLFEAQLVALTAFNRTELDILIAKKETIKIGLQNALKYGNALAESVQYGTGSAKASNTRVREILKILRGTLNA